MDTQCSGQQLSLQGLDKRKIIIENAGLVNSGDGGLLLLGKLEQRFGIIKKLTSCFSKVATTRISTRRVYVRLPQSFPYWDICRRVILELA